MKLEDIPEAIGLTLEEKLGLEVIVEPTGPEKKEAHLRLMFGGADFQTEDEGMGTEQVEAHFVLTIQSKGPGNKTWLKKVMNASNKIARLFRLGRVRWVLLAVPVIINARRTSAVDRQLYRNEAPGENPFEYYETWSLEVIINFENIEEEI